MRSLAYLILILFVGSNITLSAQTPVRQITELGTNQTIWYADTTYLLDGYVYLETGGTLIIEAGTVIKARKIPSTNHPTSALIINKGAQIIAKGAYRNPIIFTAEGDDIDIPNDLRSNDRGQWGGIIILGDAPVYNSDGATTLMEHPSLPNENKSTTFGGNNNASNSGHLSHVSIRFAGASIVSKNFSGLSLAGVGKGTIIDSVEVYASGGDGISFLGGNVDTRFVSSSFNREDAFDWDFGYQGRGQYWFGLLGEDESGNAIDGKGRLSKPVIYNATMIGPGQNSSSENSLAVRFSDGSSGTLAMSIFSDYPGKGIEIEDVTGVDDSYANLKAGDILLKFNIWSDFGSGNSFNVVNGLIAVNENADEPTAEFLKLHLIDSNYLEENYFPFISRQPNNFLYPDEDISLFSDPYPFAYPTDPFFTDYLGACFGRGAFVTLGAWWMRYWTALDQDNYLMHPCVLQFLKNGQLNFIKNDTILLYCEDIDLLDFEYRCRNSYCDFVIQKLGVAMRRKRKKKTRIEIFGIPYCYLQNIEFMGYELGNNYVDSFKFELVALVQDTTKPKLIITSCDTCDIPILVQNEDCDTSWIIRKDSLINDSLIEYRWLASDRCGNFSALTSIWNQNSELQKWYEDQDLDGYGSSNYVWWQGSLFGYSLISGDCVDTNPLVNPDAEENPMDNLDNDCDGFGNLETCKNSEFLNVGTNCNPVTYLWNRSTLENNSSIDACNSFDLLDARVDGDLWFTLVAPNSGELKIEIIADFGILKNLYRGSCDQLELLNCTRSFLDIHEAKDLIPGELLYLQISDWKGREGSFTVCAQATGEVNTTRTKTAGTPNKIKLWPNPTSEKQTITFESNNSSTGSLGIYSITGYKIKSIFLNQTIKVGQNNVSFNTSDFPKGPYWIKLETKNDVYIGKGMKI